MDSERSVEKVLRDAEKDLGAPVTVTDFVVFRLGEGIQKDSDGA
jgi:elongation factor Ts